LGYIPNIELREAADLYFGTRVRAERERRGWSQEELAKRLTDKGIPVYASTIAKIESEKKPRAARLGEAAGIADLFGVSLDSLLGRKPGAQRNELTYLLRALRQSAQKALGDLETVRELLEELPTQFDGANGPQTLSNAWGMYLAPASEALTRLAIASDFLLDHEQRRLEPSAEALMDLEVPEDEAQS
jgi:transcriptional regulator with XRE-family HTH domain